MLQNWGELCAIVEQLTLNDGYDVSPVYISTVWNILVPPKIQLLCGFYLTTS
jgi:hypothetical protein